MKKDFLIVSRKILPDYLDKVIYARNLLTNHEASTITEAVQKAGISRNTYYKYKDYVFPAVQGKEQRKAVISMMLHHKKGILSETLNCMSEVNANILTISQTIPIHDWASVVLSFDISEMQIGLDELLRMLKKIKGLANVQLIAVE